MSVGTNTKIIHITTIILVATLIVPSCYAELIYDQEPNSDDDSDVDETSKEAVVGTTDYWDGVKTELFDSLDEITAMYRKIMTEVIETNKENCEVTEYGEVVSKVGDEQLCPARCKERYLTGPVINGPPGVRGEMGDVGEPGMPGQDGLRGFPGLPCEESPGTTLQCPRGVPGPPGNPGMPGLRGRPGMPGPRGPDGIWPQALLDKLPTPYTMEDVKFWVDEEIKQWKATEFRRLATNNCEAFCTESFFPKGPVYW